MCKQSEDQGHRTAERLCRQRRRRQRREQPAISRRAPPALREHRHQGQQGGDFQQPQAAPGLRLDQQGGMAGRAEHGKVEAGGTGQGEAAQGGALPVARLRRGGEQDADPGQRLQQFAPGPAIEHDEARPTADFAQPEPIHFRQQEEGSGGGKHGQRDQGWEPGPQVAGGEEDQAGKRHDRMAQGRQHGSAIGQVLAPGQRGGNGGQHQGLGPTAGGQECFGITQHVMRAFGLRAVVAGQGEDQGEAEPERPALQPLAGHCRSGKGPGPLRRDQQDQGRAGEAKAAYQRGIKPAEQAVVVLRAEGKEDVAGVGVGRDPRQRLHGVEQAVVLDAEVAVREQPDRRQGEDGGCVELIALRIQSKKKSPPKRAFS
jgi:hypothetical protein